MARTPSPSCYHIGTPTHNGDPRRPGVRGRGWTLAAPVRTFPMEPSRMDDLYRVLGVARDADEATIRKAFRKVAASCHPDTNPDPAAVERFKRVNAAHEILGDPERRKLYDEFGEASLRTGFDPQTARAWKARGGGPDPGGGMPFGGGAFNFEDLLGGLFGGGPGARRGAAGSDVHVRVSVPLPDAARGVQLPVRVRRSATCAACGGTSGPGRPPCGTCGSTGRTQEESTLQVRIPAGVEPGKPLRLRGQGHAGARGGANGDVLVQVEVPAHPFLRRVERDLEMDVPLTLAECVEGAQVDVPVLTGRIKVKVPPGTQNGARLRIPGKGVQTSPPGDLYLVLRPQLPNAAGASDDLRAEAARLARALDAVAGERDVRAGLTL